MSDLTQALDSILIWLRQHKPNYAAQFLPGLSRQEIESKTTGLPGIIPEEIYELYQWRNGTVEEDIKATVYPSLGYLPLDEALEACKWLTSPIDNDEVLSFNGKLLFPFLCNNCSHCAVLLDHKQRKSSPVIDVQDELDLLLMYVSLTSMMMTLADYCSSGAYYIGEKDDGMYEAKGFLCPDEEKMLPIFQKYNPGVPLIW